jgi:IS5 family transposase
MGEDGVKLINEYVVGWAVNEKLADPSVVVGDTTAQEAAIPHPNEMGLMAAFVTSLLAASKRAGRVFEQFASKVKVQVKRARQKLRHYRLFGRDKSKAVKDKMVAEMANVIEAINKQLGRAVDASKKTAIRVTKYGIVAREKLVRLHHTMAKLVPQIRYWLRTGFVAPGKIISLHVPELYSIVRGKVGKSVEFGLNWGITRLGGGFLLARLALDRKELQDTTFAVNAVEDHIALFGKAPRAYAYDRGGYSVKNLKALKRLGVKEVGLAPRGRADWAVSGTTKERLVSERAQVEGGIGAVKSGRYNFHRPRARSVNMMGACGQLAILGFNLNKLVRQLAARKAVEVVG